MADGIESFDHVPQQSRRDKLREQLDRSSFLPFYDPSLISSSDILSTAAAAAANNPLFQFHHPFFDTQIPSSLLPDSNNPVLLNHCYAAFKPGPLSLSLSSQPYLSTVNVPLGPFTGYASILKGSRFLEPAQQLLEELCDVVGLRRTQSSSATSDSLSDCGVVHHSFTFNKSTLVSMLDEVYRKYKQYYQQIQEVMTSFEYISGLGNAAPYANQAIKAIQRSVQNPGFLDLQPVWRPQRGLPEQAVTVLRGWLFDHFLHPYPSDTDKLMLAKQTGLSRSQVSNWFINARVRLWKPMVEEIYNLETKQTQKNCHREEDRNAHPPSRNEPHDIPLGIQDEASNICYNLSSHPHMASNNNNGGVSLTLGLHQNNGIGGFRVGYVMGGHFGRDVVGTQLLHDFVGRNSLWL
ncbi:BEL1-like homeodomain protein 9 isoform X2 [Cucurbita maxima]|uniref:BEL1-like homeodomain protein 9 isoform X2 n=1 Tax=Cucurbita maxima TaxID=3661 RepID=A0A6J1I567_CUCMA|nr:BEL1-like homeodomain protein 9 isoform X2 [Cucurbita maxima]